MDSRLPYRQRVYSESNDPSPRSELRNRLGHQLGYIDKFPIALPLHTYQLIPKRNKQDHFKYNTPATKRQILNRLQLDGEQKSDMAEGKHSVSIQQQSKVVINRARETLSSQQKRPQRKFLPEIDKHSLNMHTVDVAATFGVSPRKELPVPPVSSNRMLEKVHKIFQILKPEGSNGVTGTISSNSIDLIKPQKPKVGCATTSNSKRTSHFFGNVSPFQIAATDQLTQIKPSDEYGQQLDKNNPHLQSSKLDGNKPRVRKPATHQNRKRHKTIETSKPPEIQLFTFYPSKKKIDMQQIDNQFL